MLQGTCPTTDRSVHRGPQPVLITAKFSAWKISINSRLRLSRLSRGRLCGSHVSPEWEAPHNIYLRRDGQPPHVMEDCFLCETEELFTMPHHPHDPTHTSPHQDRNVLTMRVITSGSPATEIPSSTMAKNLYKSSTSPAAYWRPFLHSPAELRSNFVFFFLPFLLPFALFGLNTMHCGKAFETSWTMWIQYLQIEQMSTQDLKTLDIECLHGCLFALEEYTTLIAQRLARHLRGDPWMLLDAVGWSWLVLVLLLASPFHGGGTCLSWSRAEQKRRTLH